MEGDIVLKVINKGPLEVITEFLPIGPWEIESFVELTEKSVQAPTWGRISIPVTSQRS